MSHHSIVLPAVANDVAIHPFRVFFLTYRLAYSLILPAVVDDVATHPCYVFATPSSLSGSLVLPMMSQLLLTFFFEFKLVNFLSKHLQEVCLKSLGVITVQRHLFGTNVLS